MCQQEDEQTAGETVYVCKDDTNSALLATPHSLVHSLEPCADVRTTVLSQLNRDSTRRNKTTARVTTCSKRHVSARVIYSFYLNRCGALGPTAVEDYLISEQQDARVEKSRRLAVSVQNSHLINNTVNRYCYRMLQSSCLSKNKEIDTVRKSACTTCDLQKPPAQAGENQTSRCTGPAHQQKDVFWSPYKNCAPRNKCNGKPRQHKDVQGSVNSCSLSLCRRNRKKHFHSHDVPSN